MLRSEFCQRGAAERRYQMHAHEVTVPTPGAWPNLWLDSLDPNFEVLTNRLPLIQQGKTSVEIMSSVRESARCGLASLGIETLAFAPINRNARFPPSIASLADCSFPIPFLTCHLPAPLHCNYATAQHSREVRR